MLLKIENSGNNKLNVVKEIKNITGMGLKESKDVVDIQGTFEVPDEHAESAIASLLEAGAVVVKV